MVCEYIVRNTCVLRYSHFCTHNLPLHGKQNGDDITRPFVKI